MTDFRVKLPDGEDPYTVRELDWDDTERTWTLSEKEYGEVRWSQRKPTSLDLGSLLTFFSIDTTIGPETLPSLSPGELTQIHQSSHSRVEILAALCPSCGAHWIVYKSDGGGNWQRHGRSCEFRWYRATPAEPDSDPLLRELLVVRRGAET